MFAKYSLCIGGSMKPLFRQMAAVMVGGALGAVCRVGLGSMLTEAVGAVLPVGVLCVNMAGSFLLGLLMGFFSRSRSGYPTVTAFLAAGFFGSFTTFSSFALDTVLLWKADHMALALLNAALHSVCCIALASLGWKIASKSKKAE